MQNKHPSELAPGDRVNWPDGCHSVWGTVTEVIGVTHVEGVSGPVFTGITVRLHCQHFPTFDSCGWPRSEVRIVTRTFRFAGDLYHAYTPTAA